MDETSIAQFFSEFFQPSGLIIAATIAAFVVALTILQSYIRED